MARIPVVAILPARAAAMAGLTDPGGTRIERVMRRRTPILRFVTTLPGWSALY